MTGLKENIIREIRKNHICKAWEMLHKLVHAVHCFVGFKECRKRSFERLLFIIESISKVIKIAVSSWPLPVVKIFLIITYEFFVWIVSFSTWIMVDVFGKICCVLIKFNWWICIGSIRLKYFIVFKNKLLPHLRKAIFEVLALWGMHHELQVGDELICWTEN